MELKNGPLGELLWLQNKIFEKICVEEGKQFGRLVFERNSEFFRWVDLELQYACIELSPMTIGATAREPP